MTLFDRQRTELAGRNAPLATRMRPRSLDDYIGQKHLMGKDTVLRKAIDQDRTPSMILWGPPGSGKTSLARLIARATKSQFEQLSAVDSGVKDIRTIVDDARDRLGLHGQRTILFIDEIHRFSKAQQDVLLPHVEEGIITLIGATTENPSFEVISPLLSRARVYTLDPLNEEDLNVLVNRAMSNIATGIGGDKAELSDEARAALIKVSGGDGRMALDTLELAVASTHPSATGKRVVNLATIEAALQKKSRYDKSGDLHYDTISAFIKSIRGSDPDAALYWLARMVDAGEDPVFIARRLVISAAEDIGLASPTALSIAVAAQQGVHLVGWPEARILLAEATIYLACAPKSNSAYSAIETALTDVRSLPDEPVPLHLRNAVTELDKDLGFGEGYAYAHDYENAFKPTVNLPPKFQANRYYFPTKHGVEPQIQKRLKSLWGKRYDDDLGRTSRSNSPNK